MRLAALSILTAVVAGFTVVTTEANAASIDVNKVAIEAGSLVVTGSVGKAGKLVALSGTSFKTTSKAKGKFVIRANFIPANCVVTIASGAAKLNALVTGCGLRGAKGERGATGPVGPRGAKGETGDAGPKGEKGETGAQGLQGDQGFRGPIGPRGLSGLQGSQGPRGATGAKGDTGSFGGKIMFGIVGLSGNLFQDKGLTSVTRIANKDGAYKVVFDQSIEGCALQASLQSFFTATSISIHRGSGSREALVNTRGILDSDASFNILAICL